MSIPSSVTHPAPATRKPTKTRPAPSRLRSGAPRSGCAPHTRHRIAAVTTETHGSLRIHSRLVVLTSLLRHSYVTPASSQVQAARRVRPRRTVPSRPGHSSGMGPCCTGGLARRGLGTVGVPLIPAAPGRAQRGCDNMSSSPEHHPRGHARLGGCVEERAAARGTDAPYGPQTD